MIVAAFFKKVLGEFFTSWAVKGALILIILGVIAMTGKWSFDSYQSRQEAKRLNTIGVLQNTNKELKDTIDQTLKSQDIDNKIVAQVITDKDKLKENTSVAKTRKDDKVKTIEKKYATKIDKAKSSTKNDLTKAKTLEKLEKEKAVEISTAHLEHMWSAFCDATNQGSSCMAGANV